MLKFLLFLYHALMALCVATFALVMFLFFLGWKP